MNIYTWPGSRLYRFPSVCLLIIFCLGCTITPSSELKIGEQKFDSGITLEPRQRINIYTKDKRIVRMKEHKINAKNIDGNLFVVDSGNVNGKFVIFDREEVKKVTAGGQSKYGLDDWTHEDGFICFATAGFVCAAPANHKVYWVTQNDYKSEDDYKIAFKWYQQAADQGDPIAMATLSDMYAQGRGVAKDKKTALKWYELSAAHEIAETQVGLGFLQIKAEQGDGDAQSRLGWLYEIGHGVSKDDKAAIEWYKLAAEQGNARAQFRLGWMYMTGHGVSKDYKAAIEWYKLAAEQGHADAQYNLDALYLEGRNVIQDGDSNG